MTRTEITKITIVSRAARNMTSICPEYANAIRNDKKSIVNKWTMKHEIVWLKVWVDDRLMAVRRLKMAIDIDFEACTKTMKFFTQNELHSIWINFDWMIWIIMIKMLIVTEKIKTLKISKKADVISKTLITFKKSKSAITEFMHVTN